MAYMLPVELLAKGSIEKKYGFGEVIGKGAFSEVFEGFDRTSKEKFAIKVVKKKHIKKKFLEREINIMMKIRHKGILLCHEVYETDTTIYLVLELVHGGELYDKIVDDGEYTEDETKVILLQVLDAVEYLHQQGIAHRDLKPENILCVEKKKNKRGTRFERLKIADFGLSKMFTAEDMVSQVGSPTYVAPEVLLTSEQKPSYDKAVDMWSVGVITYVLLTGCFPFYNEDKDYAALYEKIIKVEYVWPDKPKLTADAKGFIQKLLVRDPEKRFTPAQCRAHPWLKDTVLPFK